MSNNYLPTDYQNFIALSRYSRWLESENRRETWAETVARYFDFMEKHLQKNHNYALTADLRRELEEAVLGTEVMPSMRALMTAGPALERDHVGAYNCSYVPIDSPRAFDEMMYVLMCGTGVGFSVERQVVNQLPTVNEHFEKSPTVIVVDDSKAGWCRSLRELIAMLFAGQIPSWDTSKVRPAGERLKTFGGRASGPEPLEDLFRFCVKTFQNASGRKLTSLECHDIACKIGEIVVVGGVRRSALISLSNLSDERMRRAKAGAWWEKDGHRALANNSAVYTDERPDMSVFMDEWKALYESRSGERGIFSRYASWKQVAKSGRRAFGYDKSGDPVFDWSSRDRVSDYTEFGTNPCSTN